METNGQDYNDIIPTLPKEFDARQRWGPCVHPIRYMRGSAYVQALTWVLRIAEYQFCEMHGKG